MRLGVRVSGAAVIALATIALSAPMAQGAIGIEKFVAVNCTTGHENCAEELVGPYSFPKEPTKAEAEEQGYTQAGGRVPYGITHFKVTTVGEVPNAAPTGILTHIRTDVAPGLSTNPTATPQCTEEEFGAKEVIPGTGFFAAPTCKAGTEIGVNKVVVYTGAKPSPEGGDVPLAGKVYNLVQPEGLSSAFGVALELPKPLTGAVLAKGFKEAEEKGAVPGVGGFPSVAEQTFLKEQQYFGHTLIEGHIEWGKQEAGTGAGDYHDYFEISVSPALPLISSRLVFFGRSGEGDFITNGTNCPGNNTSTLRLNGAEGGTAVKTFTPSIGLSGCNLVPFEPAFALTPETKKYDEPDGFTTELMFPHNPTGLDNSQLQSATVVLPEGMTLNPAAAQGLETCTPAQARIHSATPGVACPAKSEIGTVTLEVPDLPPGSLTGHLYLGGPESGPITGPPYSMYLDAESARYGISVRLRAEIIPNEATGRVTTVFPENPEQPFSNAIFKFKPGALAPIANPLVCGPAKTETHLIPYSGTPSQSPFSTFTVDSNNAGGICPSPLPFSLSQSTEDHPTGGAENTSFTLNLARGDGNQYVSRVSTTLPEGLVGKIPAVPLCTEPPASLGTCSSTSQIGTATVTIGSGPTPAHFSGPVYFTGPFGGAPYGMTVVVPATVGPFSLGNVVTRAKVEINPFTARVTVSSQLPTIVKGVPLRLRTLTIAINRQGFLINPTNCGTLATDTALVSTFGSVASLATPFQATNCSALAFKPKFTASTSAKTSRHNGASLFVKIGYPTGLQANIKSVVVTVPKQLPSRNSTLKKACLEAVFNSNPFACPSDSRIGGATATSPVVPNKMTGPIFFVSHGGAAFPDLDMVLTGNGITIILVGNTNIIKGITTTTFAAVPDVPVTSFEMKLPVGPNSALAGNGKTFCAKQLVMPTTITAENGKVIKQNTKIAVSNCPVRIVSHRVSGHTVILTVHTYEAGRISGSGKNLKTVYKHLNKAASKTTLKVPLSNEGLKALAVRKPLFVRVRVGFLPKKKGQHSSSAFATVRVG